MLYLTACLAQIAYTLFGENEVGATVLFCDYFSEFGREEKGQFVWGNGKEPLRLNRGYSPVVKALVALIGQPPASWNWCSLGRGVSWSEGEGETIFRDCFGYPISYE